MVVSASPDSVAASVLGIDADELASCVSCGLCLPHCPTFRVTGEEKYSPRGRIDAMRAVDSGQLPIDEEFIDFVETCVQCRGCETACPSGVHYGALIEATRTTLATQGRITPWWERVGLSLLRHHRVVLLGSTALALAQRLRLVPRRLGLGRLPVRRGAALQSTGDGVWIFTGCVMDAWQRQTHRNTAALVSSVGESYAVPHGGGSCCGALHLHAGLHDKAIDTALGVMASMPGDAPILVNSAGCGAAMKEYGALVGTAAARQFSERVLDVSEWLAERVDQLPAAPAVKRPVIVQDPCHLRHVQRSHQPVRRLLAHVADVVELDDDGLCCGAGGAYSALQPELAGRVRERKVAAIDRAVARSGATTLASANPGCSIHLAAVLDLEVCHPVDLVADVLGVAEQ